MHPLYEVGEYNAKIFLRSLLFLNLHTLLLDLTPENFANIWYIKLIWLRSMKFETVQIHSISDVFDLLSSRILPPWQNDIILQLLLSIYLYGTTGQDFF